MHPIENESMYVYPVNMVTGAKLNSAEILTFSNIRNIYHPYLKHRAHFTTDDVKVEMEWDTNIKPDTLIIADTNAAEFTFSCGIISITEKLENKINIFPLENTDFTTASLGFKNADDKPVYTGLVFLGNKVELPRFIVKPQIETNIRGDSFRTNNGQAFGVILPTLKSFSMQFVCIHDERVKVIEKYLQSVQTSIPHVIDFYPEAHDTLQPQYVTLTSGLNMQKRPESDFYWNFNLEWMEAR